MQSESAEARINGADYRLLVNLAGRGIKSGSCRRCPSLVDRRPLVDADTSLTQLAPLPLSAVCIPALRQSSDERNADTSVIA
jgi:hypothetical protein